MRYLLAILGVLALGGLAFAACFEMGPWDWDYNPCEGVVCPDDGNECTEEYCSLGTCRTRPAENGTACTYDDLAGVCVEGVCGENLCEDVECDDENACTDDQCDYVDGSCYFTPVACSDENDCTEDSCEEATGCIFSPAEDGTFCSDGVCQGGACILPTDACTNAEDLAIVCEPGFVGEVEACAEPSGRLVGPCLVEDTGVSAECASCYGAVVRCIVEHCFHVCAPVQDPPACEECQVESGCDAVLNECTGDLGSDCGVGAMKLNLGAADSKFKRPFGFVRQAT
jgi:hypothetical protein